MKACALVNAAGSTALLVVVSVAGCSKSSTSEPAASPSAASAGATEPAPAATPGGDPSRTEPRTAAELLNEADEGEETRTTEAIASVVKQNRDEARACYERISKQKRGLRGELVIQFVLDPRGRVKRAELNDDRSTLKEPAVVQCVVDVIRSLEFPPSSRGMETEVNYPFNFNP